MANTPKKPTRTVAEVDALVDEKGSRIDLPEDSAIKVAGDHDATVGATGPTNWWLYGVIAMAIVIGIIFLLQVLTNAPRTPAPSTEPAQETTTTN